MVEPPGNFGRTRVLEINDGILVAIKFGFIKKRSGAMQQSAENELRIFANALLIKTRKQGGRAGPIEALVVIKDFDSQSAAISVVPELKSVWRGKSSRTIKG